MVTKVGTAGNDTLTGTADADILQGLLGNDNLFGLGGADVLDGSRGIDAARYDESPSAVFVNLSRPLEPALR